MKMQSFLLIISIICLTSILSYCTVDAEIMKMKASTFTIKSGATIMSSPNTIDLYSKSQSACAAMCLLHDACCVASFSKESSMCRLDRTGNCCVANYTAIGWSAMTRNQYCNIPVTCAEYISFGNSTYFIIEDLTEWDKAKDNCKCLGGELAELETSEENEFIKNEVRTRNDGVFGYWIGGYNFNNDLDMEWISKPNQSMQFSDMDPTQPNSPMDQLCMMMLRPFDFRWGDRPCDTPDSYICEFQYI